MTVDSEIIDSLNIDSLVIDAGEAGGGPVLGVPHFNPDLNVGTVLLSEGNQRARVAGSGNRAFGDTTHNAGEGRVYIEFLVNTSGQGNFGVNDINQTVITSGDYARYIPNSSLGLFDINGGTSNFLSFGIVSTDVIGIDVDFDSGVNIEFFKNGVSQGVATAVTTFSADLRLFLEGTGAGSFPVDVTVRTRASEMQYLPAGSSPWFPE